ncbi:DeoR/GlpR family DNA-binding transcription regulator [Aliiroseovarius sp. M344]|uniref:DeoR/GlpR family DNA-binding transcription regulator n=1 Tax=Aliiroseovarius sp. M344 TaxID=2867010 RepID=UPI0021ADB52F|nr:DeoR/GlpR family DNA-binding transcription regulator [Aliiroseovarius sp. M344]UWQ14543.1 DeoR/GlpR family DNA-binding transcription regulator [Aliiroseovarius sp. M344]
MNHITTNQREEEILRELSRIGGSCRISVLARELGVTNETIRRNIRNLEDRNIVRKVHGGVHLIEDLKEPTFESRLENKAESKEDLARAVAETINDGDSLFLDIGSTTAYVALALKNHSNLFVVTNSAFVASTLATRNNNRVFMAGGELRPHDGGAFGVEAHDLVRRLNVRFAILSVGAINAEFGLMLHDLQEANLAQLAMDNAQVCVVIADSEKLGKRAPVVMEKMSQIDLLFTDKTPTQEIAQMLEKHEIEVVVTA